MEFSNEPSETLHYGIAEVRIPESFRVTGVQRPEIPRGHADWKHGDRGHRGMDIIHVSTEKNLG